ncbi:MAG TPA: serine hydrolase [Caldilinea sp.]|nr:serine hydrolase [Caldilinea sp.]
MRRRPFPSARFITYTLLVIALLSLFPLYSWYKQVAAPIPPGVRLGGVDVTGMKTVDEIRAHLDPIYHDLLAVRFQNRLLRLDPDDFGFTVDFDQMVADAGRYLGGWEFVDIAVREAIGLPQQVRNVPVRYTLDEAKLRAWLEAAARELNTDPVAARVLDTSTPAAEPADGAQPTPAPDFPATVPQPRRGLQWVPGAPGYEIDVDASVARIIDGLTSHDPRDVDLAIREVPPPMPTMDDLTPQLVRLLDDYPAFTTLHVIDLQHGDAAGVDGDAAFSAMATLRIALAAAVMEKLPDGIAADDPDAQQVGQWLDLALGKDPNEPANSALAWLGNGSTAVGAQRLTSFVQRLGLENTFAQGEFGGTASAPLVTSSNQRERPNTRPDANMQTTPADMATLLAAIYECTQDRGLLRATFPETIMPDECGTILFYLTHNELRDAIWRGLPDWDAQWTVHRHGLLPAQHGDVALVWGPTGPYVIAVYVFNPGLVGWEVANQSVADLSRIVWEFFDFQRSQGGPVATEAPIFSHPPGYDAVDQYAPSAANPDGK